MSVPSDETKQLHEAIKSVHDVIEAGHMYAVEEAADDLACALDEGGYDVKVETMEELIADVDKLLAAEGLDEEFKTKLRSKLTRAKKALASLFATKSHRDRLASVEIAKDRKAEKKALAGVNRWHEKAKAKGDAPYDNPDNEKAKAYNAQSIARHQNRNLAAKLKPTDIIAMKKAAVASAKPS